MGQALGPSAYVFEGVWTNWTKGAIAGVTLTLRPAHATLLTNSLALYVTLAGGQLWTIMRFIFHQIRSTAQARSENHSKHQVVLRNTTTDLGTAQFMLNLAWTTRRQVPKANSYAVLIATVAIAHAILFMIAGTFSNVVANAGPTVLSRSPFCGIWNDTYLDIAGDGPNEDSRETFALSMQYISKTVEDTQLALSYAQTCYMSDEKSTSPSCKTYQVPTYNFTAHNTSCPFAADLCASEGLMLETTLIDSHHDLGINARPEDRIIYQKRATCAVLNTTGHVSSRLDPTDNTDLVDIPDQNISYAYYGRALFGATPWTYSYNNLAQYNTNYSASLGQPYLFNIQWHYANDTTDVNTTFSAFVPVSGLDLPSTDLTLFFMSYVGAYLDQVDDPWFSAHHLHATSTPVAIAKTRYDPDRIISPLGCVEQHRFCTTKTCTPYLGAIQLEDPEAFVATLTPRQNVTFNRIWNAAGESFLGPVVESLAVGTTPVLAASQTITGEHVFGFGLPDNQWQTEVNYWYTVAMSLFQQKFVEYNTGQIAADTKYLLPPESKEAAWWCKNLMIPSTEFQSFSVLTLILILVFGTLIILSSLMIEQIASWAQKRSGSTRSLARRESWDNDDMLVLQDRANSASLWKPLPPPKDRELPSCQQRSDASSVGNAAPPPYRTRSDLEEQKIWDCEKSRRQFMQSWI